MNHIRHEKPNNPTEIIYFIIGLIAAASTGLYEYITNPFMSYVKIVFSIFVSILCIWFIRCTITDYKDKLKLAKRCTEKDLAFIDFIGLELRQGSQTHHSAFMLLNFKGNQKKFINITDDIRITYSKEQEFPIFYNPHDKTEFVYDNTTNKSSLST